MPYETGQVPRNYSAQFIRRELQRVGEAYNFQEAIGGLAIGTTDTPVPQNLDVTPINMNCWVQRVPSEVVGDGPVQVDPQISPASGKLVIHQSGIFLMTWYITFGHAKGVTIGYELYINTVQAGIGASVDASQQSEVSGLTMSGMIPLSEGDVLEIRAVSSDGPEAVTYTSGAFQVIKLRDVRTRFA